MIKVIFFDLDNTLYDYYYANDRALDFVYKILKRKKNISKDEFIKKYNQSKKEIRKELNHSPDSHDRMVYFQRMGENLNLDLNFTLKLYEEYYKYFLKNIKPKKDLLKTFKEIKKRKLKILILTNEVIETQLEKIKKLGVIKYIDYIISSENVGIDKTDKKIFSYAIKKVKRNPNEILMVGDNEVEDILKAKKVKIKAILISNNKQKTEADYSIKQIPEVLKIINNLKERGEK